MMMADYFENPDGIYALSHSVGPLTIASKAALDKHYLATWAQQGGDAWPSWLGQIDQFCEHVGRVINASGDDICPQVNLAAGFYGFLTAIAKRKRVKSKNTILMHKDAFASMGFVVTGLAKTFDLKLQFIDAPPNCFDAWTQAFERDDVLACLITHVHSNTSVKSDVAAISKIAKDFEAFVCVDIAQSVGIMTIDINRWHVDAVFGSSVKWLCGGPGAGFMYVKRELSNQISPDPIGWFSHEDPFEFDISHFVQAKNAKRFWGGTPSIAPFVIAKASISTILEIGVENIVSHNRKLKATLISGLPNQALFDDVKENYKNLGGSLCLRAIDVERTRLALSREDVKFDERNEIFRISMHAVNTEEEASIIATCFNSS